jgi:hypothetical protein
MRRLKQLYLAGGLAIVASLAFTSVASATHGGQTANLSFTPNGKAEKSGTPGALRVQLANTDDPSTPSIIPPLLNQYVSELSSGITLDYQSFPVCTTSLENLTADQAQAACGNTAPKANNALIGTAAATVQIGPNVVNATGLAFNGPGPEITVFIRADALNVTTIIHCALGTSNAKLPLYNNKFTCPIPPLAGGAGAVTSVDFNFERTEVKKKKKSFGAEASKKKKKKKKKTITIIRGKCPPSGSYSYQSTFTYDDHATEVIVNNQPC